MKYKIFVVCFWYKSKFGFDTEINRVVEATDIEAAKANIHRHYKNVIFNTIREIGG